MIMLYSFHQYLTTLTTCKYSTLYVCSISHNDNKEQVGHKMTSRYTLLTVLLRSLPVQDSKLSSKIVYLSWRICSFTEFVLS